MNKLVMAAMLATASLAGLPGSAGAFQITLPFSIGQPKTPPAAVPQATVPQAGVEMVQATDPSLRILELEEQIRSLNGRIEEMSFQLLQMQEQMRKTQEDNEFRFQDLEGGAAKPGGQQNGSLQRPATAAAPSDSVAGIITQTPDAGLPAGTNQTSPGTAPGEQLLGSIQLDQNGMPTIATRNEGVSNSAALPGVDPGLAPGQTAALTSENDVYQVAYAHVLSGDYALAENEFRQFIERFPNSQRVADANFWLGEAQFSQGNFNEAAKTFLNAHQTYGSSPKAPEMLLKLGMSLAALENVETACATMREVTKRYPKASRAVVSKVASEQKRLGC
ncbi:tol-pal system protein YbgF [Peteryoungia desertarenae]|uniref:Cell division coordinator CpoB n=1 Tax=Peteryoungia desertarenae TaxID=1813451 RepID=A0ABX6QRE3_9HYPH|nr:tol-pal system protein YbgF [Peteryoungia desertarenae]QLF71179.1 tol-pal system protein YbgF [Peteryoungia desertarenae]